MAKNGKLDPTIGRDEGMLHFTNAARPVLTGCRDPKDNTKYVDASLKSANLD